LAKLVAGGDVFLEAEGVEVIVDGADGDLEIFGDAGNGPAVEEAAEDLIAARGRAVGLGTVGTLARGNSRG